MRWTNPETRRTNFDRLNGLEVSGELIPIGDLLIDGLGDCHFRGRGGRLRLAASDRQQKSGEDTGAAVRGMTHINSVRGSRLRPATESMEQTVVPIGNMGYVTDR